MIGDNILVVEIKGDNAIETEDSEFVQNRQKLKFAKDHFERLNDMQNNRRYYFKFLSPKDYEHFFDRIRKGTYISFKSELESALEE